MRIGNREIGPGCPPFFICDLGANHDGDLDRELMLIDRAIDAGADAIKPQIFQAKTIVSQRGFVELGQIGHQADWKKSVYETYEDASMPLEWIPVLAERCKRAGVAFIVTPYSLELVDVVEPYVDAYKGGSGDLTYPELFRHMAIKGKPIIIGTGASTTREVRRVFWDVLHPYTDDVVLLQCNTNYEVDHNKLRYSNLNVLHWLKAEYPYAEVGLSDHTPGHITACAAVALGASVIEKHFTDDKGRPGPDHAFAMEPEEWRDMVTAARQTWEALGDGIKKVEENEREARIVQRRALRYAKPIYAGTTLEREDVIPLRPCPEEGLPPYELYGLLGRKMARDVVADTLVRLEDFE